MNLIFRLFAAQLVVSWFFGSAQAHDFKVGNMVIDHPYATPTLSGQSTGAVYFRNLRNRGTEADRLLSAQSAAAARVALHRMQMQGEVMRMSAVPAIEIPAKSEMRMGHASTDGYHLMLEELKAPLKDGDSFALTLRFEKAGERTVQVHVQTPRKGATHEHNH
jgi:periplasmic copper chaperone A